MPVLFKNLKAVSDIALATEQLVKGGPAARSRAASTLARRLPAWVKRDIGSQFNLPATAIGSALRCSAGESAVRLTVTGRPIGLPKFGARQTRQGVTVSIERGSPVTLPHAFLATPTGPIAATGEQAYVRASVADLSAGGGRVQVTATTEKDRHGYPISRLAGPSVADMYRDGDREQRSLDYAQEVFADEVDRLTDAFHGG